MAIPIDPSMLVIEQDFRIKQNPLSQIRIRGDLEELDKGYISSSPLNIEEEDNMDLCSSPP